MAAARHNGRARTRWPRELRNENGAILVEALLVIPIITVLAIGVLEFGNVLWQRHQIETGVRDAARYWSRCRPSFGSCSVSTARNIAFYGTPNPGAGHAPRVPGWDAAGDLTITPSSPPTLPASTDLVTVTGSHDYQGSPLFAALEIPLITLTYSYEQRYVGW